MKKYALIGKSLKHSFSPSFFQQYFADNEIEATYDNIELPSIDEFVNVKAWYDGFNVTIPYKEEIIPYLDKVDSVAEKVGAVNTVKVVDDKLIGFNTDVIGFSRMIKPFLARQHERAIIFGTGGASKAVEYVLKDLGIDVLFVSRKPREENHFSYDDVNEHMLSACKLLVNCTPVGTYPDVEACLDVPYEYLTNEHLVIDLIYNPEMTEFLNRSKQQGAMILNGGEMLRIQAMESYNIWVS